MICAFISDPLGSDARGKFGEHLKLEVVPAAQVNFTLFCAQQTSVCNLT